METGPSDQCVICHCPLISEAPVPMQREALVTVNCGHVYHYQCAAFWLKGALKKGGDCACAICRTTVRRVTKLWAFGDASKNLDHEFDELVIALEKKCFEKDYSTLLTLTLENEQLRMELETSKVDCVRQQKLVDKYKGDSLKYEKAMMKSMNKESDQNKIISSLKLRMDDFISQQQRTEARLNAEISSLKKYKISKKIENLMIGDDFGQDTDISGSQHDADYIRALERSLRSISRDLETKNETNRILRVKIERFERSINVSSERKSFDLFLNSLETSNEKDDDPEVTLIDEFPVSDSTVKMSPIKINDEVISIKNRKIEPPPKFFNRKYRKIVS